MGEGLSTSRKLLGVLFFLFFALIALYGFFSDFLLLYKGIFFKHDIIIFEKTTMYMLGAGIFCAFAFIMVLYLLLKKKQFFPDYQKYMFIIPFCIMFILPQIISFYVHNHIEEINYIKCPNEHAIRFKYNTKYVFAKDIKTCSKYEEYKEKMR